MKLDSKPGAQGRCQQTGTGGGANEGEGIEFQLHRAGSRALVNHNINLVVLHGGIEILLHNRVEAVYLINEKNIALIKTCEKAGKVSWFVQDRTRCHFQLDLQLV